MFMLVRSRGAQAVSDPQWKLHPWVSGVSEPILWGQSALWREKLELAYAGRHLLSLNSV